MALFNFFKKDKPKDTNPFAGLFTLDLPKLLENSVECYRHTIDGKLNSIEYECFLDEPVLLTFNAIRLRIGSEEKILSKDTTLIITFVIKEATAISEQAEFVVNAVMKACGKDDFYTARDKERFNSGVWHGRSILENRLVSIELDDIDGLTLCITDYQHFL